MGGEWSPSYHKVFYPPYPVHGKPGGSQNQSGCSDENIHCPARNLTDPLVIHPTAWTLWQFCYPGPSLWNNWYLPLCVPLIFHNVYLRFESYSHDYKDYSLGM
jgi:hypothetical protein